MIGIIKGDTQNIDFKVINYKMRVISASCAVRNSVMIL